MSGNNTCNNDPKGSTCFRKQNGEIWLGYDGGTDILYIDPRIAKYLEHPNNNDGNRFATLDEVTAAAASAPTIVHVNGSATIGSLDTNAFCHDTATVSLFDAADSSGITCNVVNNYDSSGIMTIDSELNGQTDSTWQPGESVTIFSDSTEWRII